MAAGYSGTPLVKKLGIAPGENVVAINPPADYRLLVDDLPDGVAIGTRAMMGARFVHLFVRRRATLAKRLTALRGKLASAGVVWVSWPKKTSGVMSDVTEDVIRAVALPLGFVDVKVCAVNETWSGLKLMIRREKRKK